MTSFHIFSVFKSAGRLLFTSPQFSPVCCLFVMCSLILYPLLSLSLSSLTRPPPFSIDFCPCPSVFHSHSFIRLPFAVPCSEFNSFPAAAAAAVPFFAPFQSIHSDRQLSPSSSIQQKNIQRNVDFHDSATGQKRGLQLLGRTSQSQRSHKVSSQ